MCFGCLDSLEGYFGNLFFSFGHFCKGNMTLNIVCKLLWLYRERYFDNLLFAFGHFYKMNMTLNVVCKLLWLYR